MDIIPILSTVIVVAVVITLVIAITAFIVFRVRESKRGKEKRQVAIEGKPQLTVSVPEKVTDVVASTPSTSTPALTLTSQNQVKVNTCPECGRWPENFSFTFWCPVCREWMIGKRGMSEFLASHSSYVSPDPSYMETSVALVRGNSLPADPGENEEIVFR